jgi:hypothetical protein
MSDDLLIAALDDGKIMRRHDCEAEISSSW